MSWILSLFSEAKVSEIDAVVPLVATQTKRQRQREPVIPGTLNTSNADMTLSNSPLLLGSASDVGEENVLGDEIARASGTSANESVQAPMVRQFL